MLNIVFCFTPTVGIQCEMFHATSDTALIISDLFRFIPMMLARMIISLKKVASLQQLHLDPEILSGSPAQLQDGYSTRMVGTIPLAVLERGHQ